MHARGASRWRAAALREERSEGECGGTRARFTYLRKHAFCARCFFSSPRVFVRPSPDCFSLPLRVGNLLEIARNKPPLPWLLPCRVFPSVFMVAFLSRYVSRRAIATLRIERERENERGIKGEGKVSEEKDLWACLLVRVVFSTRSLASSPFLVFRPERCSAFQFRSSMYVALFVSLYRSTYSGWIERETEIATNRMHPIYECVFVWFVYKGDKCTLVKQMVWFKMIFFQYFSSIRANCTRR